MKFCKRYQEYMQRRDDLPSVGLKRLKKILKRCRRECQSQGGVPAKQLIRQGGGGGGGGGEDVAGGGEERGGGLVAGGSRCADNCPVCDGTFFPALLDEMAAVVGCFNDRARKLLELHLASGVRKYLVWIKGRLHGGGGGGALMHRGKDLVNYAIINAVAMRKILKKYDKIHYSRQGQAFKSKAQVLHIEILQSPWLCELMAFYLNLRKSEDRMLITTTAPPSPPPFSGPFGDCSLTFDGDTPTLSCGGLLFDSLKLDINLTCSICLETVFDPVALTCGHIFCYSCCCSAASVPIVHGLKASDPKAKCPLCRQPNVYGRGVRLDELNCLVKQSCPEYWRDRLRSERVERVRQAKEYWESQCRVFAGY